MKSLTKTNFKQFGFLFLSLIITQLKGQIILADIGFDKNENKYVVGTFDKIIDLGNKNLLASAGESDIFIGKYDSKGVCQWGTTIGGKTSDDVRGIYVEPNGNFYITGYITGEAKFGAVKKKVGSSKLFVAKYNTSGDPMWIKISNNKGTDNGTGITSDNKGNIFVVGSFDNTLVFDGKSIPSTGKSDMFVIKLSGAGSTIWLKNYGDKEDGYGSTIFYNGNKLVLGGSKKLDAGNYAGYLAELNPDNGGINWEKNIGTKKGSVDKINIDQSMNYIVTGSMENVSPKGESTDLFVCKINPQDGKEIWMKRFNSNNAKGADIVCNTKGEIFVAGNFSDSLNFVPTYLGGFFEDFFLSKLSSTGVTLWAKSFGSVKTDAATRLLIRNENLILAGTYSDKITLGKKELIGRKNTVFLTFFDMQKTLFTNATNLIQEDPDSEWDSKVTDISGKLLIGAGNDKSFLNDQSLYIEDENGNFLKRTVTDENGDFSFKNIDASTPVNLVLEKNENLKPTDEIYLAQQNGIIVQKLELNKEFKFRILPVVLHKLEPMEVVDPVVTLKDFKLSTENQLVLIERISYEPNSYAIPQDALADLNQIALFLKQNQKTKIIIHSYTDANGDEASNLTLSEKRAEEVKNYLIKKQIQTERIIAKGLGETEILNRCVNNVRCTDYEHSYNRRTEFKFIKGNGL